MDVKRGVAAVVFALLFAIAWPNPGAIGKETRSSAGHQIDLNCNPAVSDACAKARLKEGRRLFDVEKFGGNGRTCRTCHSNRTGTFSPEEVLVPADEVPQVAAGQAEAAADAADGQAPDSDTDASAPAADN